MQPELFWAKVDRRGENECWPWTAATNGRYGKFAVKIKGTRRSKMGYAHRRSWEIENGPIPGGLEICHRCDNPLCCNPKHLFAGSRLENAHDMVAKGRAPIPAHKLSKPALRDEIIAARESGTTYTELENRYGISRATIWRLVHGKSWGASTATTRATRGVA